MLSGHSSWTTSSWMLMNTVLSSNVQMALLVEFSLGFLLIQPTIQKSRYHFLTLLFILTLFSRILHASIKFLGQYTLLSSLPRYHTIAIWIFGYDTYSILKYGAILGKGAQRMS